GACPCHVTFFDRSRPTAALYPRDDPLSRLPTTVPGLQAGAEVPDKSPLYFSGFVRYNDSRVRRPRSRRRGGCDRTQHGAACKNIAVPTKIDNHSHEQGVTIDQTTPCARPVAPDRKAYHPARTGYNRPMENLFGQLDLPDAPPRHP